MKIIIILLWIFLTIFVIYFLIKSHNIECSLKNKYNFEKNISNKKEIKYKEKVIKNIIIIIVFVWIFSLILMGRILIN